MGILFRHAIYTHIKIYPKDTKTAIEKEKEEAFTSPS
jgi:hypothetical protein